MPTEGAPEKVNGKVNGAHPTPDEEDDTPDEEDDMTNDSDIGSIDDEPSQEDVIEFLKKSRVQRKATVNKTRMDFKAVTESKVGLKLTKRLHKSP